MPPRTIAIVPVRAIEGAKTRLAERLDPEERADLVSELLVRTIRAARPRVAGVLVVSADEDALALAAAEGAEPVRQDDAGLNAALRLGREAALERGAEAILVLPPDLAAIDEAEVARLLEAAGDADPTVVLVPDRHGRGTNVLLLRPPGVIDFDFGTGSRERHAAAARAAGAGPVELDGALALDVDTPEDLLLAESALGRHVL